jgi:hypothetical protein
MHRRTNRGPTSTNRPHGIHVFPQQQQALTKLGTSERFPPTRHWPSPADQTFSTAWYCRACRSGPRLATHSFVKPDENGQQQTTKPNNGFLMRERTIMMHVNKGNKQQKQQRRRKALRRRSGHASTRAQPPSSSTSSVVNAAFFQQHGRTHSVGRRSKGGGRASQQGKQASAELHRRLCSPCSFEDLLFVGAVRQWVAG